MPTPPATSVAGGRTARRSSIASAAAKPSTMRRSCSAASKVRCAASRTTTIGRTRCGARSWSMRSAICCCTATPSARSSKSRIGWPAASRCSRSPTCAAPRSCGAQAPIDWFEIDSTQVDRPGRVDDHVNPYQTTAEQAQAQGATCAKEEGAVVAADPVARKPLHFSCRIPNLRGSRLPPRDASVP